MDTKRKQKRIALYGTDSVAFRRVCGKIERRTFKPSCMFTWYADNEGVSELWICYPLREEETRQLE